MVADEIVRGAVPVLVSITVFWLLVVIGGLELTHTTSPKLMDIGETVSAGAGAGFTVNVKFCTAFGVTPLLAVKVIG
jgi:hypothetical protein